MSRWFRAVYILLHSYPCVQVQGFERARAQFGEVGRYRGFFHCLLTVYRHEGLMAFYKGTVPTVLKVSSQLCTIC